MSERKPTRARTRANPVETPTQPERDGHSDWGIPAGGFDSFREAAAHLRRPFTPEALRFKVQSAFGPKGNPNGCLVVGYIDARLVIERLNLVVPGLWTARYEPVTGTKLMWCHLTVGDATDHAFGGAITRSDVGESPKGMSKDLVSDALKRAAVHFGIGVSTYAVPQIRLFLPRDQKHIEVRGQGEKKTIVLTDWGHASLRKTYARWLEEYGREKFGPPLDHGDQEGQVDLEPEPVEPEPEQAQDPEAERLREEARQGYAAICQVTPGGTAIEYFPQAFNTDLVKAGASVAGLKKLLKDLDEKLARARNAVMT